MAKVQPNQRSLNLLRKEGYHAATCEKWIQFPDKFHPGKIIRKRIDLFGAFDIVAVHRTIQGTSYIQTTTAAHQAEHITKMLDISLVKEVLISGNRVFVHGWRLAGARGARKLWECTITQLFLNEAGEVATAKVSIGDNAVEEKVDSVEPSQQAIGFDSF